MLTIGKGNFGLVTTQQALHICFPTVNSLQNAESRNHAILGAWKYFLP